MPRRNRNVQWTQRSKILRALEGAEQRVVNRTMNPRWDERGSTCVWAVVLVAMLAALVLAVSTVAPAHAKGRHDTQVSERGWQVTPGINQDGRNPIVYAQRMERRWYSIQLADSSWWRVNRCKSDEITGNPHQTCWWNARTMGNGLGRSFAVLDGVKHVVVGGTTVRMMWTYEDCPRRVGKYYEQAIGGTVVMSWCQR